MPGQTTQTVRILLTDDTTIEPNQSFYFELYNASGGVVATPSVTATIYDNDTTAGTPVVSVADVVVDETAGMANFVVQLSRPGAGAVSVDYATLAGSATAADFSAATGTIVFSPGEIIRVIQIPITNDTFAEVAEQFNLVLSNVSGGTLRPDSNGTATIGANDVLPVPVPLISTESVSVGEDQSYVDFVVRLSAPSETEVSVQYITDYGTATSGGSSSDYYSRAETLVFMPGQTTQTVRILLTDDTTIEPNQSFYFELYNASGGVVATPSVTATIYDNDTTAGTPVVSVADVVVDEAAGMANFVVQLSRPGAGAVSVDYATQAGSATAADFSAATGTIVFSPGEIIRVIQIPITNDTLAEVAEQFNLVLSNVSGGTLRPDSNGTATIGANDVLPVPVPLISTESVSVGEDQSYVDFVVRLSAPSETDVSVQYITDYGTATSGGSSSDYYSRAETLVFMPGQTTQTVRILLTDDTTIEPNQSFYFELYNASGGVVATPSVTATIYDNDNGQTILSYGNSNDRYVVTGSNAVILEASGGGYDVVVSSIDYVLGANLERLELTGTADLNGTGNAEANVIVGNGASNSILGGSGDDRLFGLGGDDRLLGGNGNDYLSGGDGDDRLYGQAGADTLAGGAGVDTADFYASTTGISVNLSATSVINGETYSRGYYGDAASDLFNRVENIRGSATGNDRILGDAGSNRLIGEGGNDFLDGSRGNDRLEAGQGNDTLIGGVGNDTLILNSDLMRDALVFRTELDGLDVATGFEVAVDVVRISTAGFGLAAGSTVGNGVTFVTGTGATGTGPCLVWNDTTDVLSLDLNGASAGGVTELVRLYSVTGLSAANIELF